MDERTDNLGLDRTLGNRWDTEKYPWAFVKDAEGIPHPLMISNNAARLWELMECGLSDEDILDAFMQELNGCREAFEQQSLDSEAD